MLELVVLHDARPTRTRGDRDEASGANSRTSWTTTRHCLAIEVLAARCKWRRCVRDLRHRRIDRHQAVCVIGPEDVRERLRRRVGRWLAKLERLQPLVAHLIPGLDRNGSVET